MAVMKKERGTAPVVIGDMYHDVMKTFFEKNKVSKRYQCEMALDKFFEKEAPDLYEKLKKKGEER